MPNKIYSCSVYPELVVAIPAGRSIAFRDGVFETSNPGRQSLLEESQSFRNGLVKVIAEGDADDAQELPSKTASMRMSKSELVDLGRAFGLDLNMDMKKNELLEKVLALYEE